MILGDFIFLGEIPFVLIKAKLPNSQFPQYTIIPSKRIPLKEEKGYKGYIKKTAISPNFIEKNRFYNLVYAMYGFSDDEIEIIAI